MKSFSRETQTLNRMNPMDSKRPVSILPKNRDSYLDQANAIGSGRHVEKSTREESQHEHENCHLNKDKLMDQTRDAVYPILHAMLSNFSYPAQPATSQSTTMNMRQQSAAIGSPYSKPLSPDSLKTTPSNVDHSSERNAYLSSQAAAPDQSKTAPSEERQSFLYSGSFSSQIRPSAADQSYVRRGAVPSQTAPSYWSKRTQSKAGQSSLLDGSFSARYMDQSSLNSGAFSSRAAIPDVGQSSGPERSYGQCSFPSVSTTMSGGSMAENPSLTARRIWATTLLNRYPRSYLKMYAYALYNYKKRQQLQMA